jgi:hypothetical protein
MRELFCTEQNRVEARLPQGKIGDSDNALKYLYKVKVPYLMDLANKLRESVSAK